MNDELRPMVGFFTRPATVLTMMILASVSTSGCKTTGVVISSGVISGVTMAGFSQRANEFCDSADPAQKSLCTPELKESLQFIPRKSGHLQLTITGTGTCTKGKIDWGDGDVTMLLDATFPISEQHFYGGWQGKKNIRIKGVTNCVGELTKRISVGDLPSGDEIYTLAFKPNSSVCNPVPHVPWVRKDSVLALTASNAKLKYGLPEFDAGGDPRQPAPNNYAFPGYNIYSVIYRIGNQVPVQGRPGRVIFRAEQDGALEICVNDHPAQLGDNNGAIRIDISINEAGAATF